MTTFSYHVSHEQFAPSELLDFVVAAEAAGFDAAFSSDHFNPWSSSQGQSGFAWAWLGAALQATRRLTFSAITVPGGWRYSPAVLAQAIATLGQMYPGRVPWVALGSGQALNEQVTGAPWPAKVERNRRLRVGADIIGALLAGQTVTRDDAPGVLDAYLWTRPGAAATRLVVAATTEATCEWAGSWADGLLTVGFEVAEVGRLIEAFRRGGGRGKPVYLKVNVSWARSESEAMRAAHEAWRFNALGSDVNWDLRLPKHFAQATRHLRPPDLRACVYPAVDDARTIERLRDLSALGVSGIDLHHVGPDQAEFIRDFGKKILPSVQSPRADP